MNEDMWRFMEPVADKLVELFELMRKYGDLHRHDNGLDWYVKTPRQVTVVPWDLVQIAAGMSGRLAVAGNEGVRVTRWSLVEVIR